MEIINCHDALSAIVSLVKAYAEMNGAFASATVALLLKPFTSTNLANILMAMGAAVLLWRKKSWIFSGLLHKN